MSRKSQLGLVKSTRDALDYLVQVGDEERKQLFIEKHVYERKEIEDYLWTKRRTLHQEGHA